MKAVFFFGTLLLAMPALAQEPIVSPSPTKAFQFSFSGPSPVFQQPRGVRPAKTQAQFNLGAKLRVLESKTLGKISVETDNLISTDAFDQAGRYGANLHYERPLVGSTLLVGRFGFASNQAGSQQALMGTLGSQWTLLGGDLNVNFIQFDSRLKRNTALSPRHQAASVFAPNLGLTFPPFFLLKRTEQPTLADTIHFTLESRAWYFPNEKAAVGFTPARFESQLRAALVVPEKALPFKTPFLHGMSVSYVTGASEANGFAPLTNLRFNALLTPPVLPSLSSLTKLPGLPKIPSPPVR
ncbi:hypothetical protein [Armatimonas sp.]|uniref:hypothetical protein n=1 Tax=Armatimonas sp. TaxID=1872638 RepID=UPI00286AAE2D|nr:hypothetical protein [Armatimonas sp.]